MYFYGTFWRHFDFVFCDLNIKILSRSKQFTHKKYEFQPPIPHIKMIASVDKLLQLATGLNSPKEQIPEGFYDTITEPTGDLIRFFRNSLFCFNNKKKVKLHHLLSH